MKYRTKYSTAGFLSDGSGNPPVVIEVPAGTRCTPTGDGAFFAEGWREWGGPELAAGTLRDHDATHRGIRVWSVNVEEIA